LGSVVLKGWDPLSGFTPYSAPPETKSSDGIVDAAIDVEVLVDVATDVEVVADAAIDVEVVADAAIDVEVLVDAAIDVEGVAVVAAVPSLPEVAIVDVSVTTASETDVVVGTVGSEVSTPAGSPPQAPATRTQTSRAIRNFTPANRIP